MTRSTALVVGALAALGSCGGGQARDALATARDVKSTTTVSASSVAAAARSVILDQPAVWPATDVVFETPEAAAEDFVTHAVGECYVIGGFQHGDARSGEIEVFSAGEECSGPPLGPRSRLLMRQLGSDDGWFVTAAVSGPESITVPAPRSEVPAGPLTVKGFGSGFESTVNVFAFRSGDRHAVLDHALTTGATFGPPAPFTVTLDLSDASPGDVVALLVLGDSGIGDGPFTATPVVISADHLVATL